MTDNDQGRLVLGPIPTDTAPKCGACHRTATAALGTERHDPIAQETDSHQVVYLCIDHAFSLAFQATELLNTLSLLTDGQEPSAAILHDLVKRSVPLAHDATREYVLRELQARESGSPAGETPCSHTVDVIDEAWVPQEVPAASHFGHCPECEHRDEQWREALEEEAQLGGLAHLASQGGDDD